MTREEFKALKTGDIVRGTLTGTVWLVSANYGDRVTAVQTMDMTNPGEWSLQFKAKHEAAKGYR